MVMSAPHFLWGDPSLIEAVDGLEPVIDRHDTILQVEPMTGVPLYGHKRIMVRNKGQNSPEAIFW